jgi:hypothetical protein
VHHVPCPLERHEYATLEGAGHMMHWTEPTRLADVVARFLDAAGA